MDQTQREGEPGLCDGATDVEVLDCTSNMDNSEIQDGTIQIDIVREYEN